MGGAERIDDGRTVIDLAWVQMDLARCKAELDAMWLLNWRMAVHVAQGELTAAESSSIKVFGTERTLDVFRLLAGIIGAAGYLTPRLARGAAAGAHRGVGAPGADQHLRRRRQRGPARDCGNRRSRHDAGDPMSRVDETRPEELFRYPDHSAALAALAGQSSGAPVLSPDAVNLAMIRHWVEAMGDENPAYVSDAAARGAGFEQLYAPPTMLQAWIMRGLRASLEVELARAAGTSQGDGGPNEVMMALLEAEGLTSVVATNCEQTYERPLVVGDRVMARSVIESISEPKRTGLGTGRFVTTRMDFVAVPDATVPDPPSGTGRGLSDDELSSLYDSGDPVATMRFRILKYLPPRPAAKEAAPAAGPTDAPARGRRVHVLHRPRTTRSGSRGRGTTTS